VNGIWIVHDSCSRKHLTNLIEKKPNSSVLDSIAIPCFLLLASGIGCSRLLIPRAAARYVARRSAGF
jgi:hypothetical protein